MEGINSEVLILMTSTCRGDQKDGYRVLWKDLWEQEKLHRDLLCTCSESVLFGVSFGMEEESTTSNFKRSAQEWKTGLYSVEPLLSLKKGASLFPPVLSSVYICVRKVCVYTYMCVWLRGTWELDP